MLMTKRERELYLEAKPPPDDGPLLTRAEVEAKGR